MVRPRIWPYKTLLLIVLSCKDVRATQSIVLLRTEEMRLNT